MRYYNQVFNNLDSQIPPKILEVYFQKYLPYLSQRYSPAVLLFIHGDSSYENMLAVFTRDFFTGKTADAVKYFLDGYSPTYTSGENYLPPVRRKPYIQKELAYFIEAFGPNQKKSAIRVLGTTHACVSNIIDDDSGLLF